MELSGSTPLLLGLLAILTLMVSAFWGLAILSGWRKLYQRYGSPSWPVPKGTHGLSGKIGPVKYENLLFVAFDEGGVYLGLFPLFRIGHPTLFIPWSEFNRVRFSNHVIFDRVVTSIGDPRITTIRLPLKSVRGTLLDPGMATSRSAGM